MRLSLLAVLLPLAAPARAASVVYEHPLVKTRLVVHTIDGAKSPDAVTYEGPKGFYLVKDAELGSLSRQDGWTGWYYDVDAFTAEGFSVARVSYEQPVVTRYDDAAVVEKIWSVIAVLRGNGKEQAPDEFAARVAALGRRVEDARWRFRSLTTAQMMVGGAVKDPADLAAQEPAIAAAEAEIKACADLRVTGEADAARAGATPSNPDPKAAFYWAQSLRLDRAGRSLAEARRDLDWQPIPAY